MTNSNILKCSYIHGEKIIDTDQGKFMITPKCNDKHKIFRYLEQRDFPFFLPMEDLSDDKDEVYRYDFDDVDLEDKAVDLVHLLSLLHIKTTSYRDITMDAVKELYEDLSSRIEQEITYYRNLQDTMESHVYMSPDHYFLIRNISLFYDNLELSRSFLEQWYEIKQDSKRERVVFLHKMPSLLHFVDKKPAYFTHWDLSEKGYPVYDFLYFYQKHFQELEMSSLYEIYQSRFLFSKDEEYLFFSLLLLSDVFSFTSDIYQNTVLLQQLILYQLKARDFVLKQNHKNQETNNQEFNQ